MYRVLGCIRNYRPPEGAIQGFDNDEVTKDIYNRLIIELSGVHSLLDDDDVTVMVYRGRDPVLLDSTGKNAIPGASQRIDFHWGSKFIQKLHGQIHGGVLTTDPADFVYPWAVFYIATDEFMHAARFQLKLTPTHAEGLIGGYSDIESWYSQMMRSYSTHHQSYGQSSAPSIYKALRRLADGYPGSEIRRQHGHLIGFARKIYPGGDRAGIEAATCHGGPAEADCSLLRPAFPPLNRGGIRRERPPVCLDRRCVEAIACQRL